MTDPTPPAPSEDRYAYRVAITSIGIEAPLWTWQIDLEVGNGVLDWGQAHSRRQAVRQVTRRIKRHSRRTRKEQAYDWHR